MQLQSQQRKRPCKQPWNHQDIDLVMGLVVKEMGKVQAAKGLARVLALELANWCRLRSPPAA